VPVFDAAYPTPNQFQSPEAILEYFDRRLKLPLTELYDLETERFLGGVPLDSGQAYRLDVAQSSYRATFKEVVEGLLEAGSSVNTVLNFVDEQSKLRKNVITSVARFRPRWLPGNSERPPWYKFREAAENNRLRGRMELRHLLANIAVAEVDWDKPNLTDTNRLETSNIILADLQLRMSAEHRFLHSPFLAE
jgi:hypothetical protein